MPDLKLLLLEDSPEDEKLLLRAYRKVGYEIQKKRIQSESEMREWLKKEQWDIIISDYSMPSFDGIHALRVLKETELDIPFIIVSGHIGEDTAVAAMREGADDYVMKDNLHRLVPATERAIKEAKDRRKRIKAERNVKEIRMRMEGIIASAMDAIVTTNQQQEIVMMNKAAEELFGYKSEDILGEPLGILLPHRFQGSHQEHMVHFSKSGKTSRGMGFNKTLYGVKSDGTEFPVEATISQVQVRDKRYFTAILRDISLRLKAEEQEKQLNAELIQQNEQLQQFGFITSHNMRGPVATIIGLINLLSEQLGDTQDAGARELLKHLETTVAKLDQVIIDMNVILEHKTQISTVKEEITLEDILMTVESGLAPYIKKSKAIIRTDFEVERMYSVRTYIHSILYNLMSNAIKFRDVNRPLRIGISSSLEEHQAKQMVCLSFTDNGMGIDLKANRDRIFGLYKRFHHHVEGKGLGLHLVKTQVEALGGDIVVESEVGKGTTFNVFLPYEDQPVRSEETDRHHL